MIGRYVKEDIDDFLLPYDKILIIFEYLKMTTKTGKEITHLDLRKAIDTMEKKHPNCRWKTDKLRNKKHYILIEGFHWLRYVYFQKKKTLLEADISFFELRIRQYEELLKITADKNWWTKDMDINELKNYFDKEETTIRKAINKMCSYGYDDYKLCEDGKVIISAKGIEWLCKNVFREKYLELLEKCKMELTQKYMDAGYGYDQFIEWLK